MSLLNPTADELNALLVRIADGLPSYALDAHAALASLSTALDQKIAAVAVLEKRVRELEAYRNSIRSVDLEFDTPTVAGPAPRSSPPKLALVPWDPEPAP